MRASALATAAVVLVLATLVSAQSPTPPPAGNACSLNGKDYSKLTGATDYQATLSDGGTDYTMDFNICKAISKSCNGVQDVACCQSWGTGSQNAGLTSQQTITAGDGGVIFTYKGGEGNRETAIVIACGGSEAPSNWKASNLSPTSYQITGESSLACGAGGKKKGGLSGGWIFFIILVSTTTVYFIGGIVYKKQRLGASGAEAIPNVDFWRDLPGLVKDGFSFTLGLCGRGGGSAGGYSDMP